MKKVTYVKIIGIIFLIASLTLIFMTLSIGATSPLFGGGMTFIISILFLTKPALTYDDEKIQQRALIGPAARTHYFATDNITTRDNQIYKGKKRLKLSSYMLLPSEYYALVEHVRSKETDVSNDKETSVSNSKKHNDDLLDSEI